MPHLCRRPRDPREDPKLAVILVLTSLVSAGYYMPVIMAMYMRSSRAPLVYHDRGLPGTARFAVLVSVVLILVLMGRI